MSSSPSASTKTHLVVVDPGTIKPELQSLNRLIRRSSLPITYHLPGLFGLNSLNDESESIAGIIVFGSASSVNERTDWQKALEAWLMPRIEKGTPFFGICYGHQMLANMFGGKVDFISADRKKFLGSRKVFLQANPLWGDQPIEGNLCVSHCEIVTDCGSALRVVGQSPEVKIEALHHPTLPVWSVQGHPEATDCFLKNRGSGSSAALDFGHRLVDAFLRFATTASKKA